MMANARGVKNTALIFTCLMLFTAGSDLYSQEASLGQHPGRAVEMHINARIVEQNGQVAWNQDYIRVTIAGRPVGLKLLGDELVVEAQFTPFLRANGKHTLVAQGQIWINIPDEGVRYYTTMQTIPLGYGEQVYFFPLGSMKPQEGSHIEIELMLEPYSRLTTDINSANIRHNRHIDPVLPDDDQKVPGSPPESPKNTGSETPSSR